MKPAAARPPRPPARGAALLMAMLLLVMVVTITASMVWQQARAVDVESAERARAQSSWIISGALDWARLILREDGRTQQRAGRALDSLDEPWATPLAEARLSTFLAADQDNNTDTGSEAFLSGRIEDAQSRWNLRNLVDAAGKEVPAEKAALARLCQLAGVPGDTAELISAGLRRAWAPGAADGIEAAPLAPQRLTELEWLGIAPATLRRLAPWVDLLPRATPVNANTAPREVLVAAIDGLDLGSAQRLVQARQRKPFEGLDDVKAQLPPTMVIEPARLGVASSFFLVEGRLRLDDRALEELSLLERRGPDRDHEVVVLRRERINPGMPPR
jgi:general secretion pathway protein K